MSDSDRASTLQSAYEDLQRRSLSRIHGDLGRLIYLASTRDYNTGTYHHEGLAARFSPEVASKALETAHREIFHRLATNSLRQLVGELETYVNSSAQGRAEVLHVWQNLEPYRVAIPVNVHRVVSRLFISNLRLALAILRESQGQRPPSSSRA